MGEKTIPSEKTLKKPNVSVRPEECSDKEGVKAINSRPQRCPKTRRTVKLPRLKLEDLVAQVTEENTHEEVSTGPPVGHEVW